MPPHWNVLYAQTAEIQRRVEAELWFQWVHRRIEAAGNPPVLLTLSLAVLAVAVVGAVWLWRSRKRN